MKLTVRYKESPKEAWMIHVDRSTRRNTSRVGMVLINQGGQRIEHAVHFSFATTNNVVEYEALLAGIRTTDTIGVTKIKIHTDSQFVAS